MCLYMHSKCVCVYMYICIVCIVRVAQMEEAWTVNHVVDSSSPSWVKLTKSLLQAFNLKITGSFGLRPKLGGPVYQNIIESMLNIHLCSSHIGQVLRLSGAVGAVNTDMLPFAFLRITLTSSEVVGTEN